MSGEQKGREDTGEEYTIAVDDDGGVTLRLDRRLQDGLGVAHGDALHVGRIEDYPALRRKLGEEGVLGAVWGAVGDDVNVRRAAPGETDNSAVGVGADTRLFDLRGLGTVITAFKNSRKSAVGGSLVDARAIADIDLLDAAIEEGQRRRRRWLLRFLRVAIRGVAGR